MYMSNRRPLGVTIIAILIAIGGIFSIISGLQLLSFLPAYAFLYIILGALSLILAWGLWTLQSWAFWLAVVITVLNLINDIIYLTRGAGGSTFVSLILHVAILAYLFMDQNVRSAFRT